MNTYTIGTQQDSGVTMLYYLTVSTLRSHMADKTSENSAWEGRGNAALMYKNNEFYLLVV